MADIPHQPIMVAAILTGLQVESRPQAIYIDGTLGAGGHTQAILETRPDNRVIGFDRDPAALHIAETRLAVYHDRLQLIHASYLEMSHFSNVDGVLLDLGLSSMQLDNAGRGFAFRLQGPLDMRFDPNADSPTAADLVNELPADALADIFFRYGEEKHSRRIARAIVDARPLKTTTQLATLIESLNLRGEKRIHPATRIFQALRIVVNDELGAVERVLPMALGCLKQGGRLAVITFHSLEDRIVKHYFKRESTECLCPPRQPVCTCDHQPTLALVNRKPIIANAAEVAHNRRARSAKVRIAERL